MNKPDLTGAVWKKSRRSGGNGNCVEVAVLQGMIAVRDSKDPDGPVLTFTRDGWSSFVEGVKDDQADW